MLGLNRNIWILAIVGPLALAVSPAIVLISGFVGKALAPSPALATLPLTIMIVGMTVGTVPAALLMQRYGRKLVFLAASAVNIIACLVTALGVFVGSFWLFLFGVLVSGTTLAVAQQFRFAAVENTSEEYGARAISVLMLGSVAAAFVGTELAAFGQTWFSVEYAGSFVALTGASVLAFLLLLFFNPRVNKQVATSSESTIDWKDLLTRPVFLLAVASATIGYGVMSFVMTATPLAMHDLMNHSMGDTKWVIQSHIMAMFLPSLITGELIRRLGDLSVIALGLLAYFATTVFAFAGVEVFHYWWALVLLGVGWNFLFIGGTTLLTKAYQPHEKFRVQAVNDFSVFVFQALSSAGAGLILFIGGWNAIVTVSLIPTMLLLLGLVLFLSRHSFSLRVN